MKKQIFLFFIVTVLCLFIRCNYEDVMEEMKGSPDYEPAEYDVTKWDQSLWQ